MTDVFDDPDFKEWAEDVLNDMAPKLEASAFAMMLYGGHHDVKLWVEMGASIYMDKPIVTVVFDNAPIPRNLLRVSDEIVKIKDMNSEEDRLKIEAAIERVLARLDNDA